MVSTRKVLDWIFEHPRRALAFGKGSDFDIAFCTSIYDCHAIQDNDGRILGVIFYERDDKKKNLEIKHILAEKAGFNALLNAWQIYFPDYTVSGERFRSKKRVAHQLSDFKVEPYELRHES